MNGKEWTPAEDRRLRKLYPHRPTKEVAVLLNRPICSVNGRAFNAGLHKTRAYMAALKPRVVEKLLRFGAPHRFRPGLIPANKGLRRPGYAPGRMAETQFKKGQKPWTYRFPIGSTRLRKEGYLLRKISETGYPPDDWRAEHLLLWEKKYGPLPASHALRFKDGNKTNIALDNLELITRAENMRRNSIHRLMPPDVKAAIYALIALKRTLTIREKKRGQEQALRSA